MSSAKQRLKALSQQLVEGIPSEGNFEDIPKIRHIAGDSAGQRVKDKVIIITGANSPLGIGRATAHQFAQNGAKAIFLCDYSNSHLPIHTRELNQLFPTVKVHSHTFDVSDEDAVKAVVDEAVEKYGRLDIMFANAGVSGQPDMYSNISGETFLSTLRINTVGVFLCAKYAAQAMQKTGKDKPYPGGSIVVTASIAGLRSNAGSTDYSASKAAVISIAQTMAFQLTGTGIRINAICPGLIETGMTEPMFEMARERGTEKKIGQLNPLRRPAVADEVARVALFLGSDEASYVNGQAWPVCGGLSAGHPVVVGKIS